MESPEPGRGSRRPRSSGAHRRMIKVSVVPSPCASACERLGQKSELVHIEALGGSAGDKRRDSICRRWFAGGRGQPARKTWGVARLSRGVSERTPTRPRLFHNSESVGWCATLDLRERRPAHAARCRQLSSESLRSLRKRRRLSATNPSTQRRGTDVVSQMLGCCKSAPRAEEVLCEGDEGAWRLRRPSTLPRRRRIPESCLLTRGSFSPLLRTSPGERVAGASMAVVVDDETFAIEPHLRARRRRPSSRTAPNPIPDRSAGNARGGVGPSRRAAGELRRAHDRSEQPPSTNFLDEESRRTSRRVAIVGEHARWLEASP